jgi:hypothetical protein
VKASPYTQAQLASILECVSEECVSEDKRLVEKFVVSAATEYIRSLELPPLKRANPAREIAQLNTALQSMVKALSNLSSTSESFLDSTRRDPGSQDPSSHDEITDCRTLSNCIHRFLIENKEGLASMAAGGARPGRPEVNDKLRLLKRLDLAFLIGRGKSARGRPKFLKRCAAPERMKLQTQEGTTNWWDDLGRKKAVAKRRD